MLSPYNYSENEQGYFFLTDHSLEYHIIFSKANEYFMKYPDFNEDIMMLVIALKSSISPPLDPKVEITIVDILNKYFKKNTNNIIVYVCDNSDERHIARFRKFKTWFSRNQASNPDLFFLDGKIEDQEILSAIIFNKKHTYKDLIIVSFLNYIEELKEKFSST